MFEICFVSLFPLIDLIFKPCLTPNYSTQNEDIIVPLKLKSQTSSVVEDLSIFSYFMH